MRKYHNFDEILFKKSATTAATTTTTQQQQWQQWNQQQQQQQQQRQQQQQQQQQFQQWQQFQQQQQRQQFQQWQQQQQQQRQRKRRTERENEVVEFNFARDIERGQHTCRNCNQIFVDPQARDRHEREHDKVKSYKCCHCGSGFKKVQNKRQHERRCRASNPSQER